MPPASGQRPKRDRSHYFARHRAQRAAQRAEMGLASGPVTKTTALERFYLDWTAGQLFALPPRGDCRRVFKEHVMQELIRLNAGDMRHWTMATLGNWYRNNRVRLHLATHDPARYGPLSAIVDDEYVARSFVFPLFFLFFFPHFCSRKQIVVKIVKIDGLISDN